MNLSPAGLALLKVSEGFRSQTYFDVAGFRTIGFGHRLTPGEVFPEGVTVNEANDILAHDIAIAEASVKYLVKVPLTQGQFDALVDFVFNLGGTRLLGSTLLRLLNAGNVDQAGLELLKWNHAGQTIVPALTRRRTAEYHLWTGKAA
jgi:lysozyme